MAQIWMISSNINTSQMVDGQLQTPAMNMISTMDFANGIRRRFPYAYICLLEVSTLSTIQVTTLSTCVNKIMSFSNTSSLVTKGSLTTEKYLFLKGMMDILGISDFTWTSANFITGTYRMTLATNVNTPNLGWYSKPNTGTMWTDRYTWVSDNFDSFTKTLANV